VMSLLMARSASEVALVALIVDGIRWADEFC
jgi:hypothetical protein